MGLPGTIPAALASVLMASAATAVADGAYREPSNPAIVELLTAPQVPTGLLHAASGRGALVYRETLVPIDRIARTHLGLAGYWIDPTLRASGYDSWTQRVVVTDLRAGTTVAKWAPTGPPALDHVEFSPDGSRLSAITFRTGAPRLVIFDIDAGRERVLSVAVNPAFGKPCTWIKADAMLCRIVPDERAEPPVPPFPSPNIIENTGGPAPTRTYGNLLDNAYEEALFEHYFEATLAVVHVDDRLRRLDATQGMLARVQPSPDGKFALVARLQRPYSHVLRATHFPRTVELWDIARGVKLAAATLPQQRGITATKGVPLRTFRWKSGPTATLGWIEAVESGGERWVELLAPFSGTSREVTRHESGIGAFEWTNLGTPVFAQHTNRGTEVSYFVVRPDGAPERIWQGAVKDLYGNPGSAVRVDGTRGPILEFDRRIFLTSDGLGPEGPSPFVDALNLDTLKTDRIAQAPEGIYERLMGIVDPKSRLAVTVRESETEPPQVNVGTIEERRLLTVLDNPFPQLDQVERRNVRYTRADGVPLNGMLYLPRDRDPAKPLPTLVWIYPAEYSGEELAAQVDSRRYRFHQIKEASPIAVVLAGYALLLNPTVPIIGEGETANDAYVPQLVSSMEAAINYLVEQGISDRDRMAVGGRSYGAFSTANLLVHTDLFRTGIAISGAYNRTLTPFGFQHEKRSFWEATDFYTRMSPFYLADEITEPLLLMHGGADDNPGTPTLQAQRFFHALLGNGVNVRYVVLPFERHHYRARENVLHTSAEMLDWLDRTIGAGRK